MIDGLKVLALIPARGGSKGIAGKNTYPVGGRPMIEWTAEAAKSSRFVDRTILSSDDERAMKICRALGVDVPFVRDAQLARDTTPTVDVVIDALKRVPGYDIVVLLQPTSPLRTREDVDGALRAMLDARAPACVSVREAQDHPYWSFRLEGNRLTPFVPLPDLPTRRQDLPAAWCLNGAVYAARTAWFLQARTFLSNESVGFPMPAERSIDVDVLADVEAVNQVLSSGAGSQR